MSDEHPHVHVQVGTPIYMAPETLSGKPHDPAADTWAFGCVIFEAMCLKAPWQQLDDGFGGIEGGMAGLLKCVTKETLDTESLKVHMISHGAHRISTWS